MRSVRLRVLLFALCASSLTVMCLQGCSRGPGIGQVSGKVTFKGSPVSEGTITFINPDTGQIAEAALEADGAFVIKTDEGGLVVGDYIVMVTPPSYIDRSDPKTPPSPVEKATPNIPIPYRNQATSPLRATVKKGPNVFEFNMTPEGQ